MSSHVFSGYLTSERLPDSVRIPTYVLCTTLLALSVHWALQIVQLVRKRWRDHEALKEFPGPKGHWFFGDLKELLKYEERPQYSMMIARTYPKACRNRMDPYRVHLRVHHPETIKAITGTLEPKDPFGYRFLIPWIGEGLLISKGHRWARNRRLLTPAFHFDILKPYVTVFSQSAHTMVTKWRRMLQKSDEPLEMFEHVSLMTLDSLMKCIFGFQGDCQVEGFKHPYIQGVYELASLVVRRFLFFPYHSDLLYHLSWSGYKFRRACRLVHSYSQDVIRRKREELAGGQRTNAPTKSGKIVDFMDVLLQAKDESGVGLTDEEIQAEVDTFMFEGHDTTASGISWCLYNLARHPEYQEKCRNEVNNVLGDRQHFEWDDMSRLPFLTMCVKESLRLHPPVPMMGRETTKPLTFPDGRTIPAGITILISVLGCHNNPDVWENPDVYDPYRFTAENSKNRSPHAFIPFSAGPRNCIGQQFALNELKVSVGQVIRHFELSPDEKRPPIRDAMLILRTKHGLYVRVKPIND